MLFELLFAMTIAAILLALIAGFITLCIKVWQVGASVITVLVFLLAFAFLPHAHGLEYGAGNIDLDSRIVVENEDGTFSTELSFSFEMDGEIWLIPSIVDGELLSEDDAFNSFLKTGEYLGRFPTNEECNQYAEWLHLRQEAHYGLDRR